MDLSHLLMIAFFCAIAGNIIFKLLKFKKTIQTHIKEGMPAESYFSANSSAWNRTSGKVNTVAIEYIPPFTSPGSRGRYYLKVDVTYELNGTTFSCSASPYTLFPTEQKSQAKYLQTKLLEDAVVDVYTDPEQIKEPFFLYKGACTWKEIPQLIQTEFS